MAYNPKQLWDTEPAILVGLVEAFFAFVLLVTDAVDPEVVAGGLAFFTLFLNATYVRGKTITKHTMEGVRRLAAIGAQPEADSVPGREDLPDPDGH